MTVRSTTRLILSNETRILEPGIYRGGIQLRNSSVALLRPGIFVFEGGGLEIGAQAQVLAVSTAATTSSSSMWGASCPLNACGVMLYNTVYAPRRRSRWAATATGRAATPST